MATTECSKHIDNTAEQADEMFTYISEEISKIEGLMDPEQPGFFGRLIGKQNITPLEADYGEKLNEFYQKAKPTKY